MYLNTLKSYSIDCDFLNKDIEDTHSINHISYKDRRSLLNLPLNWLSKLLLKNGINYLHESDDIVIIDNMDNLPEEITKHIQPFYTNYYPCLDKYGSFISSIGTTDYKGTFNLFVEYLKKESKYVSYAHVNGDCFLFNGIKLRNLYDLMFHSTLKQEEILRYLATIEYDYSIDTNKINEEVEKILAKH